MQQAHSMPATNQPLRRDASMSVGATCPSCICLHDMSVTVMYHWHVCLCNEPIVRPSMRNSEQASPARLFVRHAGNACVHGGAALSMRHAVGMSIGASQREKDYPYNCASTNSRCRMCLSVRHAPGTSGYALMCHKNICQCDTLLACQPMQIATSARVCSMRRQRISEWHAHRRPSMLQSELILCTCGTSVCVTYVWYIRLYKIFVSVTCQQSASRCTGITVFARYHLRRAKRARE